MRERHPVIPYSPGLRIRRDAMCLFSSCCNSSVRPRTTGSGNTHTPSQIAMETNMTQALASPETDERPRTNVAIQRAVRDGLPTPKQRNAKAHSNARQLKAKVQAFWERVCAASPHEPVHTNDTVDRDRGVAALKSEVIAPTPLSSLPWTRFVAGRNASRQPNDTRMTRWPVYGS